MKVGEIRPGCDADLIIDMLLSAFPYRLYVTRRNIPHDMAERVVDIILRGVLTGGAADAVTV